MKNSFIKNIALIVTVMGATTGCENFLDQPTPGKISQTEFYKSEKDAQQATIAIYDRLSNQYYATWQSMYMLKTMPSDESNAGGSGNGDQTGYQNLDDFTVDSQNDKVQSIWQQCYSVIQRANTTINKTESTSEIQKRLIAEAKALRAYAYFDLVTLWGDVPLVLNDISPSQYVGFPRTSKTEIYAQIEKDLTEAIPDLWLKSKYAAADRFRISKGTAQAILGKVFMYESAAVGNGGLGVNKWSNAAAQFQAVIDSHEYGLEKNLATTFSRKGEFGTESLFELSFIDYQYNWGNFPWGGAPESNIHIQLMGPRGDFYTKAPSDSLIGGWGFNLAKGKLYNALEVNDGRKNATVMSLAELRAAGGQWTGETSWDFDGFFQRKYASYSTQTNGTEPNVGDLNYGTNFRLIRYADVLLMAAESYNRMGGKDVEALANLNLVRQRPGTHLPPVAVTGSALFNAIVHERFIELAFEGFRYPDLIRWGLAEQELSPLGYKAGKHNLMPIPNADVLSAHLPQNPLY
jgi:hypothetical protein